ncbi:MAG TPA: SGNH/GDSL hydrolase family protein [Gemmataceae bacterium]|jgi:acyl-CoA thioesterase-1|nr:SGNH/GDSL hydrolase family protein [Gemmataceae bacterium]
MRVLFFGDSICNGQGIALHKGWVPRLSASLSDLAAAAGKELVVINSAVNGRTTRQALETMPYEVQSQAPAVLVVQFGMNDCNIWQTDRGNPRVSPLAFEGNLREIVQRGLTFGARAVYLHTNHPTTRDEAPLAHSPNTYEAQNRAYNEIIRRVATTSDSRVRFLDIAAVFHEAVAGDPEGARRFVLPDGLHLSEAGHDLYYRTVFPPLATCVRDLLAE